MVYYIHLNISISNTSYIEEIGIEEGNMANMNTISDMSMKYLIPTLILVIFINIGAVLLFRKASISNFTALYQPSGTKSPRSPPAIILQHLEHPTAWKIQKGHEGVQDGQKDLKKGLTLGYWTLQSTFAK